MVHTSKTIFVFFVRLNDVETKFLEQRAHDMTEWKDASGPVKDWISAHEKKIRSLGLVKTDHDSVVRQREGVEVI